MHICNILIFFGVNPRILEFKARGGLCGRMIANHFINKCERLTGLIIVTHIYQEEYLVGATLRE